MKDRFNRYVELLLISLVSFLLGKLSKRVNEEKLTDVINDSLPEGLYVDDVKPSTVTFSTRIEEPLFSDQEGYQAQKKDSVVVNKVSKMSATNYIRKKSAYTYRGSYVQKEKGKTEIKET